MKRTAMPPRKTPMKRTPIKQKVPRARQPKPHRETTEFSPAVRRQVKERSLDRCEVGGPQCTGQATHMHHRKSRRFPGTGTAENALHSCETCHAHVHGNPALAYERGWMIRGNGAVDKPAA